MAIRTAATGPSPARRFAAPYAPSELRLPVSGSAGQSRPPCRIPPRPNAAALLACCLQVTLNLSPALLAVVLEEQRQTKPGEIRNLDFAGSRGCLRRHHAGQARRRGPGKPEISGQHGGVGIQDEASRKPVAGRRHPLPGSTPLVESDPAGLGAAPRRLRRSSPAACWQTEAGRPAKERRSGSVQWICLTEAAAAG